MSAGKGDRPRHDPVKYGKNYDEIFRKPKPKKANTEISNEGKWYEE